ncbi:GNAT family N-acetyltransferase [Vibrio viridaestus]|uniref:N-acetyltransferase n=1 Tax=Vibrio viridaestus TaxID=2487322 RepID=A0A3N9TIF5_9VIBR|nr:N-acetyltransferase [Vibrio viridaestus]RQW63870.1 N-acetyltransferase [Vibrio viridaestus]
MLIRTEAPADILPIDNLISQHNSDSQFASSLMELREGGKITLSLVACNDDGELVAHVAFLPVLIDGYENGWQIMTPITLGKDCEGDIQYDLINDGISTLFELGYSACFISGDGSALEKYGFAKYGDNLWGTDDGSNSILENQDWLKWINVNSF